MTSIIGPITQFQNVKSSVTLVTQNKMNEVKMSELKLKPGKHLGPEIESVIGMSETGQKIWARSFLGFVELSDISDRFHYIFGF
jgi:hypothetical protein